MQKELSVSVLARSETSGSKLAGQLSAIPALQHLLIVYAGSTPLREQFGLSLPDVVLLEMDGLDEVLLEDIRQFVETHGQTTEVFATFPTPDMHLVKHLVRSGVRDVLPQPVSAQELETALANTRARKGRSENGEARRGRVCSLMKTRGNAGGTFLAINIASQLASEFRKTTALLDLDLQFGTVASSLDISTERNVAEALLNPQRIDGVFLESLMTRHTEHLNVLPSPGDLSSYNLLSPNGVARLITALAETHEHVVISLPLHVNEGVVQALNLSDPLLLVTQDSVSSLRNLQMMITQLPTQGVTLDRLQVIQNRTGGSLKGLSESELARLVNNAPVHTVRSDYKLAAAAENAGKPASELSARAGMVRDIHAITTHIAEPGMADKKASRTSPRRWFSTLLQEG